MNKKTTDPLITDQETPIKEQVTDPMQTESKPLQPWQRPPFEVGHELSLKHGTRSPRVIAGRAGEVLIRLQERAPHLDVPEFEETVVLFARAAAMVELVHEYIDEMGIAGVSSRLIEQHSTAVNAASKLAGQLGIEPHSFMEIKALGSLAMLTEASFTRIAPAVPIALVAALERVGLGDHVESVKAAFIEALKESRS